jgi:preprotein translocase subunit YajC
VATSAKGVSSGYIAELIPHKLKARDKKMIFPMYFIPLMAGSGAEGGAGGGGILGFLPFILIFVIIYFLMIRPQAKRQKAQQKMIAEIKQGDNVVTIGGIHGTVSGVREQDNTLIIKINDGNKIIVDRSAVNRKTDPS